MLIRILFLLVFSSTTLVNFAQDYQKEYKAAAEKNDLPEQQRVLESWETATPKDPELFIGWFNYYVRKSKSSLISLDQTQKASDALVIADTGTGKAVGFMNFSEQYDSKWLQKGFDKIDEGIALHPKRLDMRFGKVYMLGEAENYQAFTDVLIETIHYGASIKHDWLWKDGKRTEDDPKDFFLATVQSYIHTLYNTEDDELLPFMRQISEAVLKHEPKHVESMANIALTYLVMGENEKAIPILLKAEAVDPKDVIVLNNIAEAYKRLGDKAKAKIYYEKIIRYGNEEEIEDAKQNIKTLNK